MIEAGPVILIASERGGPGAALRTLASRDAGRVLLTTGIEAAVRAARAHRPDAVVVEVRAPGPEGGLDLLRALRATGELAATPIVVHAREVRAAREARLLAGGANVLVGPAAPERVLARALAAAESRDRSPAPHVTCVLLVEPYVRRRLLLASAIAADGMVVFETRDADHALHTLRSVKPSIVATAIDLPGSSGAELARRIRERHAELPVIALGRSGEPGLFAREIPEPLSAPDLALQVRLVLAPPPEAGTMRGHLRRVV